MFVRSILALSLSCAFTTSVLAATQPSNKSQISATVEDPIDPLAVDTASEAASTKITAQEQKDLNQAANTLQKLEKSENLPEDMVKDNQDKIQKLTDKYTAIIDKEVTEKDKEVMTV